MLRVLLSRLAILILSLALFVPLLARPAVQSAAADYGVALEFPPGGTWITPGNNFTVTDNVIHYRVTAKDDNPGGKGVKKVNFTALYNGSWHVVHSQSTANGGKAKDGSNIYYYNWSALNIPAGPITISFDVYDQEGNKNLAPNGERHGKIKHPSAPPQYLPDTGCVNFPGAVPGHSENICGNFLKFFRAHGLNLGDPGVSAQESIALFGYPVSPELRQNGLTVQYFQRARMEYNPNLKQNYGIQLGRLGSEIESLHTGAAPYKLIRASSDDSCTAYSLVGNNAGNAANKGQAVTGHTVCNGIRDFWKRNGGRAIFGLPISQEITQSNGIAVQYFERARIEWHPKNKGTQYEFQLGLLGLDGLTGFPAMQMPVRGQVNVVGYLPHQVDHQGLDLYAVDFTSNTNQTVYPVAPGKVVFSGWDCSIAPGFNATTCYGNTVVLDNGKTANGDEVYSVYTHLQNGSLAKMNAALFPGDKVGTMGDTGCDLEINRTPPPASSLNHCGYAQHLHFAVRLGRPNLGAGAVWGSSTAVNVWHIAGTTLPMIPGLPSVQCSKSSLQSVGDGFCAAKSQHPIKN